MARDILLEIVEHKKTEIEKLKKKRSEKLLRDLAFEQSYSRCEREHIFYNKLKAPGPGGVNIIAEIKRASPSKGIIRENLDPSKYAIEYEKGGARALSVLTDEKYFMGNMVDLEKARQVTGLPILRKDFTISAYQIYEALLIGADAVLLIVRILTVEQLKEYLSICGELKLDALVEIHTEIDFEKASEAGAKLIGINNRNLKSFTTDISHSVRLIARFEKDQVAVAASGIQGRDDITLLKKAGLWNFLIGESLVRAGSTRGFLQGLIT